MSMPKLVNVTAQVVEDQLGHKVLVILALDNIGRLWAKAGLDGDWHPVAERRSTTPLKLQ